MHTESITVYEELQKYTEVMIRLSVRFPVQTDATSSFELQASQIFFDPLLRIELHP